MQFDVSREPLYPQADLAPEKAVYEPQRYPQAGDPNADVRVGVVPAAGGRTRWLDFGQTRDNLLARVYWSPDSQTVAAVRMNRIQNKLDILFAERESGASRAVVRETDPHWINLREDLRFIRGGKEFLWTSERDGFNHLYRYASDGKLIAQITRGDWEISDIACVDEAGANVYYVSNQTAPLDRQLFRVSLEGGEPKRISEGAGTHSINMAPKCGHYFDSYSSHAVPPRTTVYKNDGSDYLEWRKPDTKATDQYEILPSEIVEVKASDGTTLYGRLVKPADYQPGKKYPVIVGVYGGPHAQSVRNEWSGRVALDQAFAQKGYVTWELDNRGTFFRGHKFETAVYRNLGAVELEDQKAGIKKLVDMGIADPARIGIYGWSYGGFMTLYSLLNAPDTFAAGCAGAPVTHWRNYDTIYTERYMGLPSENVEGYRKSAPVNAAADLKGKLLLIHNLQDDNVLIQNSIQMAFALQNANKKFEMMLYQPKSHGLSGPGRRHYIETMVEFFDRVLKP
jgi:dipeptidyl-peptidase-4